MMNYVSKVSETLWNRKGKEGKSVKRGVATVLRLKG